jgi:hypothetical protein
MSIQFRTLYPESGDQQHTTLQKMLQQIVASGAAPVIPHDDVHVLSSVPISVDNFPAIQTVDGTISALQSGPWSVRLQDGLGNPIRSQDGHLSVVNVPFDFEIAHEGGYLGTLAYNFHIMGRRAGFNSTSVLQDVGEWLAGSINTFPELTGVETFELVSSSAQDKGTPAVGTGTHVVRVWYLDTNQDMKSVLYTLNGLTPVPVAENMLFVYGMEAFSGGSSEVSVGNIDLRVSGGGAIHERISAGGNKSLSARFRIPRNVSGYIPIWMAGSSGTTQDVRLRATVQTLDRTLGSRYLFQDTIFLGSGNHADEPLPYLRYPAGARIKISTLPGLLPAANRIDASFTIMLVGDITL